MQRPSRVILLVRRALAYLLAGACVALLIALVLWWCPVQAQGPSASGFRMVGNEYWSASVQSGMCCTFIRSDRQRTRKIGWGPEQACGPPDTPGVGDLQTAWASATPDGQKEWLDLQYVSAGRPARVRVFCTYNPGAIERVTTFGPSGEEVTIWEGIDPLRGTSNGTVADLTVSADFETSRVRVYLDSPSVSGWNEIDAVGLVDEQGNISWAQEATASSTYAAYAQRGSTNSPIAPEDLVPEWTAFSRPSDSFATGQVDTESRMAVAYGFPWPAIATVGDISGGGFVGPRSLFGTRIIGLTPNRILVGGLAINAAVTGLTLWLLGFVLTRPRRAVRELLRMRQGLCPKCGYNLRFDFSRGCPECGLLRDAGS